MHPIGAALRAATSGTRRKPSLLCARTYKGFRSGFTVLEDEGGSEDMADLSSVASYDVHFDKQSNDLLIHTTSSADGVRIRDYFTTHGRIEKVIFSDTTITGFEEANAMAAAASTAE